MTIRYMSSERVMRDTILVRNCFWGTSYMHQRRKTNPTVWKSVSMYESRIVGNAMRFTPYNKLKWIIVLLCCKLNNVLTWSSKFANFRTFFTHWIFATYHEILTELTKTSTDLKNKIFCENFSIKTFLIFFSFRAFNKKKLKYTWHDTESVLILYYLSFDFFKSVLLTWRPF